MTRAGAGKRDGWTRVRFGDVVENVNDQPKRATLPLDTRYVAGEHVDENRLTIDRWGTLGDDLVPPTFKRRFQPGDVLFHSRNLKKIAVPDFGGITGEKLFVLRSRSPALLQEFVPHVLLSPAFTTYAEASWSGSVNKFLNWTPLARYELDLPPVEAQKAIIAVASRAIAFAESATALALCAECLLQSALQELMPPGGAACRMARLGELYQVGTGGTPSRSRSDYWGGSIPWVKTGEVDYITIDATEEHITSSGLENSAAKVYPSGSLVMALFGQGPTLGRVARLGIDAATNQACAVIQSPKVEDRDLLFYWLWRQYREIRKLARGATQPNLNVGIVKSLMVPVQDGSTSRFVLTALNKLEMSVLRTRDWADRVSQKAKKVISQFLPSVNE